MIDALIAGRVYGTPAERTSKTGKPFAVAKVRAAAGDGTRPRLGAARLLSTDPASVPGFCFGRVAQHPSVVGVMLQQAV